MVYTFHLRTVTEVFAGGADIQSAELRPSAFRGPLRFWFRAMMGSIVGNDLAQLKQLEALAFGATDARSPFQIRTMPPMEELARGILKETAKSIGYNYLAFSMKDRLCLPQDTPIQVNIRFRYPDPPLQNVVLASFWLLLNFGGIGSRTRRSFGALSADKVEGAMPLDFLNFLPPEAVADHYHNGLAAVKRCFREFVTRHGLSPQQTTDPEFTTFHGWSARIISPWEFVFEAQECLGRILRGFRNGRLSSTAPWDLQPQDLQRSARTQDYFKVVAPYLKSGATPLQDLSNDALGLPIVFFSSSRKESEWNAANAARNARRPYSMRPWTATTRWKQRHENDWHDRRASPLILRPLRMKNGSFAALIAAFPCQFLPTDVGGNPSQQHLKPGGPEPRVAATYAPLPIQVCTKSEVQSTVDLLFKQVDLHFGKDSSRLPLP